MDYRGMGSYGDPHQDLHCPKYKVILVGEEGVGKTSIFRRLKDGTFQEGTVTTLGLDEFSATRELGNSGSLVRLHLWDTAGSERFRAMTKSYYHSANAVVFVFSLDRSASLISLKYWIDDAKALAPQNALHIFVCNKIDLADEEQVIYENEIGAFFASPGLSSENLYRTSAKENTGIQEVIDAVLMKLDQCSQSSSHTAGAIRMDSQEDALNPEMPPDNSIANRCC
ncbi:ras-related protein RabC-like [Sycon ciliatum]|uniref:ras-related protein RabC-like n=1 Tax=Sycon ciliatum TaxID=27933 RepID=UPI0020AC3B48|eukprot:scpid73475/ scgid15603/ Ras-related protein Rab-19